MPRSTLAPLIFLMATVVIADARRAEDGCACPSNAKVKKMDAVLARHLPGMQGAERKLAVGEALSGTSSLSESPDLLARVERESRALSTMLAGEQGRTRRVLESLVTIADANGEISAREIRVIQAVASALGTPEALMVGADVWGETILKVA